MLARGLGTCAGVTARVATSGRIFQPGVFSPAVFA